MEDMRMVETGGKQRCIFNGLKYLSAFTMAEILISLTIIGVVAAITLPSLTGNINERTWNTQRKALYSRMSQAIKLMPALSGYGKVEAATSETSAVDTAAETFVTTGLSKVMKINHFCDNDHLAECGIPSTITPIGGGSPISLNNIKTLATYNTLFANNPTRYPFPDTKAVAIETGNGESMLVYYNPKCQPDMNETNSHYSQRKMCANFIYDLNGKKGPNAVGKDIGFISALYATDSKVVAPVPLTSDASASLGSAESRLAAVHSLCSNHDASSKAPSIYELSALFYNKTLLGSTVIHETYQSDTPILGQPGYVRYLLFSTGNIAPVVNSPGSLPAASRTADVRCVKDED